MRILLITLGSSGDVHPFVGLALGLKQRGHAVTLMTSGYFAEVIQRAGVDFVPLGTKEEFESLSDNPLLWHPRKGFKIMSENLLRYLPGMYDKVIQYTRQNPKTIMVGSTLAFAARLVQEKFDAPLITVHLSPATIRSVYDTMQVPGLSILGRAPAWVKSAFFALADNLVLDRAMAPAINRFRRDLGLAPVKKIVGEWWHSPQKVIGVWPEFFAARQPDWPKQTFLTGFPLWDEIGVTPMSEAQKAFLAAGPAPVVFTPGSAMMHADEFFREAVGACEVAGVRGILLSRHRRHLPEKLPANVVHFDYAPFSELLPHCALLVHHGGIGTTAQAMATGTAQIIMPWSFDQFDNAERSQRLGVAGIIPLRQFKSERIAREIKSMIDSKHRQKVQQIQAQIMAQNAIEETCMEIEKFGAGYA